jgi:hypothetical protein
VGLTPFKSRCHSDECNGREREFEKPRKVRRLSEAPVEALQVRLACKVCHVDQDFVMTPANALDAGLKSV